MPQLKDQIEHFWTAVARGWSIEPRDYFEKEALALGFKSPIEMAVHHLWKREVKPAAVPSPPAQEEICQTARNGTSRTSSKPEKKDALNAATPPSKTVEVAPMDAAINGVVRPVSAHGSLKLETEAVPSPSVADPKESTTLGTYACPICGAAGIHAHGDGDVFNWLDAQASRFGYRLVRRKWALRHDDDRDSATYRVSHCLKRLGDADFRDFIATPMGRRIVDVFRQVQPIVEQSELLASSPVADSPTDRALGKVRELLESISAMKACRVVGLADLHEFACPYCTARAALTWLSAPSAPAAGKDKA